MTNETATLFEVGLCGAVIIGLWLWVAVDVRRKRD